MLTAIGPKQEKKKKKKKPFKKMGDTDKQQ